MARPVLTPLVVAAAAVLAGADATAVAPPPPCADRDAMRRALDARYGEAPVAVGLRSDGDLFQVFASARTGTWTVVTTAPNGVACVLAAGRGWDGALPPPPAAPADPAAWRGPPPPGPAPPPAGR